MPKKLSVKRILELDSVGMSGRDIAITLSISRNSVAEVLNTAKVMDYTWEKIKNREEGEIYKDLFPNKFNLKMEYAPVDYEVVHKELKSVGVTLKMLWNDYVIVCQKDGVLPCGYTKYCEGYRDFCQKSKFTSHIEHKPGIITEVDWSGPTMKIINDETGEVYTAYLFVGTLPYSQYSYAEATLSMDQDDWLLCHVNMFNYFGATTVRLVSDNLKTGVIKHPKMGEIVLNEAYESLGEHYGMAIMPTGVKKPKHKASVEGTVGKFATAIIAKLRHQEFHSLYELNKAILKAVDAFNAEPFQKRDGSRKEIFESMEKPSMKPLPAKPFELSSWSYSHKVGYNSHIVFQKNFYSAPFQYISKMVDIKYTKSCIEIYYDNERIATHPRFAEYIKNKYSTIESHMPEKASNPNWDVERIQNWAAKIGDNTLEVINRIINSVKIKEQSFNSALAVLKLSKVYSNSQLENACEYALTQFNIPRYSHINAILKLKQEKIETKTQVSTATGYVRGADYYGGKK